MAGRLQGGMRAGPMVRGGRRESGSKLGEKARERLRAAHELAIAGKHAEAASELDGMAAIARGRGLHRIAVHVATHGAAQAAQAGDLELARRLTTEAIGDAKADGDKSRSARAFGSLVRTLRHGEQAELADELAKEIRDGVGVAAKEQVDGEGPKVNRAMRRHLPKACPTCGGKVDADAVAFNDDASVDCPVCGDVLKG